MPIQQLLLVLLLTLFCSSSFAIVPLTEFYPYGLGNGDTELLPADRDDGSSNELQLNAPFPFFDKLHNSLWVNVNGAVSFVGSISTYTPECAPLPQNSRMIAPFWADVDLKHGGHIFYRQSFDKLILSKAKYDIESAFPEMKHVQLKWAFLATWLNVSFYRGSSCSGTKPRNSFQCVLATDGVHSFTIFYYNEINWNSGTASGGDCSGIGVQSPARAGFDAGDGKTLVKIPGSCLPDILNVDENSNFGSNGKWVYRVDNAQIQSAGCSDKFSGKIRIVPAFIDMFGHVPVAIHGPCFNETASYMCRFHDPNKIAVEVKGKLSGNMSDSKIICLAPFIYSTGRIMIDIIIADNNTEKIYSGFLYVISTQAGDNRLGLKIGTESNEKLRIEFEWNASDFPEISQVDLNIYTYNSEKEWKMWKNFDPNISNTGSYITRRSLSEFNNDFFESPFTFSVEPSQFSITNSENMRIQRELAQNNKQGIWDKVKFAALESVLDMYYIWPGDCSTWYNQDPGSPNDLLPCPPTTVQANSDPRFERDPGCITSPCAFHPGADFCIRSRLPSSSGAGQQCCYQGANILLGPCGGGTVDSHHYKSPWSHFKEDVLPWVKCCKNKCSSSKCHKYYEKRPSDPGHNYEPPQLAGAKGDPHLNTFDHLDYTFNGAGEFWLMKNSSEMPMSLQARMEPIENSNGASSSATVFTAFVMQCNNSSIVQVQRSQIRTVDIYLDQIHVELSNTVLIDMNHPSIYLYVNSDLSWITLNFECGVNLLISTNPEAFSISASCDKKFKGKTRGLLGVYDDKQDNDLQDQDGNLIPINSSLSDIHYKFGLKWRVLETESQFFYTDKTYQDYDKPDFIPNFNLPDIQSAPQEAKDVCGEAIDCLYDYMNTGSISIANQTKNIEIKFNEILDVSEHKVLMCPELTRPQNGYYQVTSFMPGAVAKYACYDDYSLQGNELAYCHESTGWNGSTPSCNAKGKGAAMPVKSDWYLLCLLSLLYKLNHF